MMPARETRPGPSWRAHVRPVSLGIRLLLPACLVIAAGPSCARTVFEPSTDVAYVLARVNGEPLPATLVVSQFGTRALVADTIRFVDGNRYERVRWITQRERGSGTIEVLRATSAGLVIRAGSSVTLVDDVCADPDSLALCVAPDTAETVGDGTLVLRGPVPPAGVKRFEAN